MSQTGLKTGDLDLDLQGQIHSQETICVSSPEPLRHACSHSQETMCVSSHEPLHHACSHSQETMCVSIPIIMINSSC